MCTLSCLQANEALFALLIGFLIAWDLVWKILALWKAARNNHLVWFVCIAVFNTIGVLPIIYLLINKSKRA